MWRLVLLNKDTGCRGESTGQIKSHPLMLEAFSLHVNGLGAYDGLIWTLENRWLDLPVDYIGDIGGHKLSGHLFFDALWWRLFGVEINP